MREVRKAIEVTGTASTRADVALTSGQEGKGVLVSEHRFGQAER